MNPSSNCIFRCRGCRQPLFKQYIHGNQDCTSYFIDKPKWLDIDDMENQIKFKCPKCSTKIGQVIFSGKKCSCHQWVTPAYQVHKNKVDRIVKN